MKKTLSLFSVLIILLSCQKKKEIKDIEVPNISRVKKEVHEGNKTLPGYALIMESDCLICHKDNQPFVGPSYAEIADKYSQEDIVLLASRIIEGGGRGIWGYNSMTAHPNISKEDAKKMVAYILSFKKSIQ